MWPHFWKSPPVIKNTHAWKVPGNFLVSGIPCRWNCSLHRMRSPVKATGKSLWHFMQFVPRNVSTFVAFPLHMITLLGLSRLPAPILTIFVYKIPFSLHMKIVFFLVTCPSNLHFTKLCTDPSEISNFNTTFKFGKGIKENGSHMRLEKHLSDQSCQLCKARWLISWYTIQAPTSIPCLLDSLYYFWAETD